MKKLRRSGAAADGQYAGAYRMRGKQWKDKYNGGTDDIGKGWGDGRRRPFGTGGFSYVSAGAAARQIRRSSGEIQ